MDIVSRLKEFINYEQVAITQFADICKIPRPTLSQLLNGRNKKVSDELIKKIHEAYPHLSVLWLMFGEGTMLQQENIRTSEPQNTGLFGFETMQNVEKDANAPQIDFEKNFTENSSENSEDPELGLSGLNSIPINLEASGSIGNPSQNHLEFDSYGKKHIVNIIVYYDDNSFESFVPGRRK